MPLYRRLLHTLDDYGPLGFFRRMPRFVDQPTPHPFDILHRTDTSGHIPGDALTPANPYNTAYYAISPSTFTHALALLPSLPPNTTFVDLGCGKGRALLLAASHFPALLGVELAPALIPIARANTAPHPQITILHADAVHTPYPATPLLVFLYHPFLPPVLRRVLTKLRAHPQPVWILYANCAYHSLLRRHATQLWDYTFPLTAQDATHDRHRTTHERYTLFHRHSSTAKAASAPPDGSAPPPTTAPRSSPPPP